jgi:glyoxylase-like metal-dependent hydrolase (beta-lactamase superfamily II)
MTGSHAPYTVTLGNAQITMLYDGELDVAGDRLFKDLPRAVWAGTVAEADGGRVTLPLTVVLARVDRETLLFDTGLGPARVAGRRGGGLVPALASLGLTPDDISRVVISHAHGDHIWGAVSDGDRPRPAFARARYHVPRADWEWLQRIPGNPSTALLGVLDAAGQLTLDEPDAQITPSLRSLDSAGHSPGHRCLALTGGGQTFCYLGDLVHHATIHFAHPDWVTAFDYQPALTPGARQRIAAQAVAGDWLLGAAHAPFPALGRLAAAGPDAWQWQPVVQ